MKELTRKLKEKFVGAEASVHPCFKGIPKENKGITLIALIITIIVMMILVAVAVTFTIGENGIFNQAKNAKQSWEIAQIKEQIQMYTIGHYDDKLRETGNFFKELLEEDAEDDDLPDWMIAYTGWINLGNLEAQLLEEFKDEEKIEILGYFDPRLSSDLEVESKYMRMSYAEMYNKQMTLWDDYKNGAFSETGDLETDINNVSAVLAMVGLRPILDNYKIKVAYQDRMLIIDSEGNITEEENSNTMEFIYEKIDDESCKVTEYLGKSANIVIPEEIEELTVTQIGDGENTILDSVQVVNIEAATGIQDFETNWQQIEAMLKNDLRSYSIRQNF